MSGFSTYLANALANHIFLGAAYSVPSGRYLALFTADPTDANLTANEIAVNGTGTPTWYARQSVSSWASPTTGSTHNNNVITFPATAGGAVTVTHWGIYDALTYGNLLCSGALAAAKVLNVDDVFTVNAGDLVQDFQ